MPPPVPEELSRIIETLYRSESGRVLATLVRLLGDLDLAEESMHEAFAAALESWTLSGIPDKPVPWLISMARFKAIDGMRRRARFFHLVALGTAGKVLVRKKFTQRQLLTYTANMQTSLIGLEACSGAHFLGRALRKQGHDVRLIAAQFVKPFVKSNKNDFVDAEAIAEAVERKNMRFVPIKTDDQLDLQAIHRVRDRLIARRTAVINQLRAFLLERGMVFAKTPSKLRTAMPDILENADVDLTPQMRNLIDLLWGEWKTVEQQIEVLSLELERISAADAGCTRIRQIPGIGPIVATAIVAAIGNGAAFRKGRDFAAWLGLVPRQYSTGGKAKLLGISKRGNVYLRKILIHGARAAVLRIKRDRAPIGAWMDALDARAPKNVVVVATANKLARIAWAVLSSGEDYRPIANAIAA